MSRDCKSDQFGRQEPNESHKHTPQMISEYSNKHKNTEYTHTLRKTVYLN